jgi:multiple sugar transport system ATP-binding protein
VQSAGLLVPVPEEFRAAAAARRGQAVVLGVRPEHIGDPREHDWAHAVPVRGTAEIVETIGHEVIVHLRSGEERLIAKLRAARRIPHYGEAMELALDADAVHLFDAQTEQRLG